MIVISVLGILCGVFLVAYGLRGNRREQLERKVIKWANDRNFFGEGGATIEGQYDKLREEWGELYDADNEVEAMDAVGDIQVVHIILKEMGECVKKYENALTVATYLQDECKILEGMDNYLDDSLEYAYNQIKDRKGKFIDGVFVKEEDLKARGIEL